MPITYTCTSATIRAGQNHHKYGDPFDFVCSVLVIGKDEVFVYGGLGALSMSTALEIKNHLCSLGFTKIRWERADGTEHVYEIK